METLHTTSQLKKVITHWQQNGFTIAFVPTMGNLHLGHLKLVEAAHAKADKVVVSIFVNPTQFGVNEDFDAYPRTEIQDVEKLTACAVDVLFLPSVCEMYPIDFKTFISVTELADLHCGVSRPGHFDGVATIVCKLFNLVQPNVAVFGEKDFQQLLIIRTLVRDLNLPISIESVATLREPDGLAMSSRNRYLTDEQRGLAPQLYQILLATQAIIEQGQRDFANLTLQQTQHLTELGFKVDYVSICNALNLLPAQLSDVDLVILAAANLGKPRLIDNIRFKIKAVDSVA